MEIQCQLGSPLVYDPSTVRVVPKYGMAKTIVTADTLLSDSTVLPSLANNSLPSPLQDRNIDNRWKLGPAYVPNPRRWFQCQEFRHMKLPCSGKSSCAECGNEAHDKPCESPKFCVNCKGLHSAWSRACPKCMARKEYASLQTPVFQTSYIQIVSQNRDFPNCHCAVNISKTFSRSMPLASARDTYSYATHYGVDEIITEEVGVGGGTGEAAKASPTGAQRKAHRGTTKTILNKKRSKAITNPSRKYSTPQSLLEKQKPLLNMPNGLKALMELSFCIPSSCSASDWQRHLIKLMEPYNVSYHVEVKEMECQTKTTRKLDTADWVAGSLIVFVALLVVASTSYDIYRPSGPGRQIGTFLHPLAATTSLLSMYHAKVVLCSVLWSFPSRVLTVPDVVVPQKGMATSIVAADTLLSATNVLPKSAGNSLPSPLQSRNMDKRRKRLRPVEPHRFFNVCKGVLT
uniref:Nose resistant-to-fluoxetine protein N-terminal domain-containing protein n=1 Tax=Timema douglasi TaxID=61478 RepID=A0A7R8VUA3_TIMDO|nr:unnamed protein product [Timema douglasi]